MESLLVPRSDGQLLETGDGSVSTPCLLGHSLLYYMIGQLYLQKGMWKGEQLLPEYWTEFVREKTETSRGVYGAHFWQHGRNRSDSEESLKRCDEMYPSRLDPSREWIFNSFPKGSYFASGYEGQLVVVVPSANAVVVKLAASKELVVEGNTYFYDRKETIRKILFSVLNTYQRTPRDRRLDMHPDEEHHHH